MRIIKDEDFTKEFEVPTISCRKIGSQATFYVPTIHAVNFFTEKLEIFPMRFRDEKDQIGLVFFLDLPKDYYYRPYKVYKLPRKYNLTDGTNKTTWSYYVPIPRQMLVDLGMDRDSQKYINLRGCFLKDGTKALLVQKRRAVV
jgi:hypothetical protein